MKFLNKIVFSTEKINDTPIKSESFSNQALEATLIRLSLMSGIKHETCSSLEIYI